MVAEVSKRAVWFRRILLLALSLAAGVLWITEGRREKEELRPQPSPAVQQQSSVRVRREEAYNKDIAALQKLTQNTDAAESTREMAAQQLAQLIEAHQAEIALENALQDAGFSDSVVVVQNNAVTVMLRPEQLNEAVSAQILSLCIAHTSVGAENVRVMALTGK